MLKKYILISVFGLFQSLCAWSEGEDIQEIIKNLFQDKKVQFVQIGAFEGNTPNDPIFTLVNKHEWTGVLIEPIPSSFEKLVENYKGIEGLYFENIAISDTSGVGVMYIIPKRNIKRCNNNQEFNQLASFNKDHIEKHIKGRKGSPINVQMEPLGYIIEKYKIEHLDLLCIDTEGHDMVILESIDFSTIQPAVILFENSHADGVLKKGSQYENCIKRLCSFGYSVIYTDYQDTIVVHESFRL